MNRPVSLALALLLASCASEEVVIENAWVRAPLPGKSMTAGYLQLHNRTAESVSVTAARASGFGDTSIHQTRLIDGVARMSSVVALDVAAGESIEFEPGGLHLMLMQPEYPLQDGDTVMLTLVLDSGEEVQVAAVVTTSEP